MTNRVPQLANSQWWCLEYPAEHGFAMNLRRPTVGPGAGLTREQVRGLVRRGLLEENENGIFRQTEAGRAALKARSERGDTYGWPLIDSRQASSQGAPQASGGAVPAAVPPPDDGGESSED